MTAGPIGPLGPAQHSTAPIGPLTQQLIGLACCVALPDFTLYKVATRPTRPIPNLSLPLPTVPHLLLHSAAAPPLVLQLVLLT
jgi:hypothetical protein